jgi:hypothetical protein
LLDIQEKASLIYKGKAGSLYLGYRRNKLSRSGRELPSTVAPPAADDRSSSPPYVLRSCSQASLLLHSSLRSPRRPRRINKAYDC